MVATIPRAFVLTAADAVIVADALLAASTVALEQAQLLELNRRAPCCVESLRDRALACRELHSRIQEGQPS